MCSSHWSLLVVFYDFDLFCFFSFFFDSDLALYEEEMELTRLEALETPTIEEYDNKVKIAMNLNQKNSSPKKKQENLKLLMFWSF